MKKITAAQKAKVLKIELISFGIKPLTNWVKREMARLERDQKENLTVSEEMAQLHEVRNGSNQGKAATQPQTVGDLIRAYPYRFVSKWRLGNSRFLVGLGKGPIAELKRKLTELGLTPDDWPALVDHNELLEKLSKKVIVGIPIQEVFVTSGGYSHQLHQYLGCKEEELGTKTVKDFISIDPFQLQDDVYRTRFFERRKRQFIALRQKLVAKGFTTRDGAFFKWNPEKQSLVKAKKVLEKYFMEFDDDMDKFARILVAERLVV